VIRPRWIPAAIDDRQLRLLRMVALALFFESYDQSLGTSALKHIAEDLGIGADRLGGTLSLIRLGAIPAFLLAPFSDRIGRRSVFLACVVAASVMTFATAFSRTTADFVVLQMITRTALVLGAVVAIVIVAEEFPAEHRGWAIGVVGALSACGHALGAALFAAAERLGKIDELGRAIRNAVVPSVPRAAPDALLFINIHAHELAADDFLGQGSPLADVASRIVLEITERSSLGHVSDLDKRLHRLRRQGFRFAVDDLGGGYAGVSALTLLEPDFVKLDRSLVMGLEESPRRRSVVRAMVRLCTHELGIQMIALGVESPAERDTLAREGVDLMQGELFAGPARDFPLPRF